MPAWTKFGYLYLSTVLSCSVCAILHLSGDQSVEIGSDVQLTCVVQNLDVPVTWVKLPNDTIYSPEKENYPLGSRIYVVRGRRKNSYVLHLRNVSWTDAGTYECRQILVNTHVSLTTRLYVKCKTVTDVEPLDPRMLFQYENEELVTSQGLDVRLFCNDTENPEAKIVWRRQNLSLIDYAQREMIFPGKYLNICNVQRRDRGTYSCEISDKVGKKVRRDVLLVVEYAPAITVPRPSVMQAVNYSIELQCFVDSVPLPEIVWFKNTSEITNDSHYSVASFVSENNIVLTTLTVTVTDAGHFGDYMCSAVNKLGFSSASLHLTESSIPILESSSTEDVAVDHKHKNFIGHPRLNLTGFILGMVPPLCISFYIILHLGFRSRYAEERPEEEGGDGLDEIVWEQGLKN